MAKSPRRAAAPSQSPALFGRVTSAHGRHFVVSTDAGPVTAHRRGKKGDVVVGDNVGLTAPVSGVCAIETVEPRKSLLFRSDEWRVKSLAANVDLVAVVFASRPSFNPWFIWRALLAARTAGLDALVIRNKTDLADEADAARAQVELLKSLGETVVEISAAGDPAAAKAALLPQLSGRAALLVGQSGMGKSSILNLMVPHACAATREFSEALNLGKQTTTASHWYDAADDDWQGSLVDTPGFQEFGLAHLSLNDILRAMPDIARFVPECRFFNCRHLQEPGCGVKAALERGLVTAERYAFYAALAATADAKPQ